jgi:phosphate acetyltransferase
MALMDTIRQKAMRKKMHILLPEGTEERTLRAAAVAAREGLAAVTLLGNEEEVYALAEQTGVELWDVGIIDPLKDGRLEEYSEAFFRLREKKGISRQEAAEKMKAPLYFAAMLLKMDCADGLIAGAQNATSDIHRAGLQIVKTMPSVSTVSACYIMSLPDHSIGADGMLLYADCSVTPNPTAQQLADIAVSTAATANALCDIVPNVAMLSFSTKGSARHPMADKVIEATRLAQQAAPSVNIDGELQADAALVASVGSIKCPGSSVAGRANVLIFPDLQSANIAYKLTQRLAGAKALGPVSPGYQHCGGIHWWGAAGYSLYASRASKQKDSGHSQ